MINLTVVETDRYHWRSLYFIGAGFSTAAAIIRACLPESRQYIIAREEAKAAGMTSRQASKRFLRECGQMLKTNCTSTLPAVDFADGLRDPMHLGCLYDDVS